MSWQDRVRERLDYLETSEGVMDLRPTGALVEFLEPDLGVVPLASLLTGWWLEYHEPFFVLLEALGEQASASGVWAEALLRRLNWWNEEAQPLVYHIIARDLERIADPGLRAWADTLPGVRRARGEAVHSRPLPSAAPERGTIPWLQARMNQLGWADIEVTGILDAPTRLALAGVQSLSDREDPQTIDARTFEALTPSEEDEEPTS